MEKRIEDIFSKMELELTAGQGASADLQNWSLNYLKNHRSRYVSDYKLVERYYSKGEILELGSAPFQFTALLNDLGLPVTGVDIDPGRFEALLQGKDFKVVKCDVEKESLPFEDDAFHLVLFNEIFEHMRIDPITTLKKIGRILHPDGFLILSTPNLYSITTYINFLLGKGFDDPYEQFEKIHKYGHMGHVREYSVSQVGRFLKETGFQTVEVRLQSHRPLKGLWSPFNLVRKVAPGFHAFQTHICKYVG